MDNRYNRHNRRKYSLKVQIVLVTKYRKQLLKGSIADDVKQKIFDIANTYGYEIIAIETDKDHIHFLLSYDTTDRVCDIVKIVKQETTYYLWHKHGSLLSKQYWKKKIIWSDGYFACSIGEVSSATIQKYMNTGGDLYEVQTTTGSRRSQPFHGLLGRVSGCPCLCSCMGAKCQRFLSCKRWFHNYRDHLPWDRCFPLEAVHRLECCCCGRCAVCNAGNQI